MKKRIVCLTLAILMCGSQVVSVMADRESDLREEQAWTSQQLDATYARMSALWDQKQQLESQIESLNSPSVAQTRSVFSYLDKCITKCYKVLKFIAI